MKKIIILSVLLLFGISFDSISQKYAYIDSDYILENMPEYNEAKEELDKLARRWQEEIEDKYMLIEKKKNEFNRVEAILPDEERERRKQDIEQLESDVREIQQMRFGVNGDLFAKRKELIEPIQDKVFDALSEVASQRNFAFVFDKANQSNLIFADSKFDISKMILTKLGISAR